MGSLGPILAHEETYALPKKDELFANVSKVI